MQAYSIPTRLDCNDGVKVRMTLELRGRVDWDAIEQEQGTCDLKLMVYLWEKSDSPMVRNYAVREISESAPGRRHMSKSQAILLGTMAEIVGLGRDTFEIRWLTNGKRDLQLVTRDSGVIDDTQPRIEMVDRPNNA